MDAVIRKMRPIILGMMGRVYKKYGVVGAIMIVGDAIVSKTKSKDDDKAWKKIKAFINKEILKVKAVKAAA
jgi:hypothetical protein